MPERTMYWDIFRITVSFAMACPLCKAQIEPNVEHACSNPKPAPKKRKIQGRKAKVRA